jgi:phage/plasmid-associated DNA primase
MADLTCEEIFDIDNLRALTTHPGVSKEQKAKLRAYKKLARDGNKVLIQYDYGKNWNKLKTGDFYALKGVGLSAFDKNIRACLAQKYYWDLDLVNAHPSIIKNHCLELGLECPVLNNFIEHRATILKEICSEHKQERWWAKEECIKVFNGGVSVVHPILIELMPEVEIIRDKVVAMNPDVYKVALIVNNGDVHRSKVTTLSIIFQDKTRKLLAEIVSFLKTKGRELDVRIHDGGLVRKLPNETCFPEELLRECESHIFTTMKYTVGLDIKPLEHSYEFCSKSSDFAQHTDTPHIYDDSGVAKIFVGLLGDKIKRRGDQVYYFNDEIGMWETGNEAFRAAVFAHRYKLTWFTNKDNGAKLYINYGGVEKNINNMGKWVFTHTVNDNFFTTHQDSSIGKFLFEDGIYDFKTNTFTPGFDPNIVFFKRIKRCFPKNRDEELIKKVNKVVFEDPFTQETQCSGLYLKKTITMALFGDYRRKTFTSVLGESNSGKGATTAIVKSTFDEYVSFWDSNELLSKDRSGMDVARQNTWLLNIADSRIAISNEMKIGSIPINVDIYKKVSSGGDVLTGRQSYGGEIEFVNKSTLVLFANDFGVFSSKDDSGVRNRSRFVRYECVFTPDPKPNTNQRLADPDIKGRFECDEWKDAFFWVIVDCYNTMGDSERRIGGALHTPQTVIEETKEWVDDESDVMKLIKEKYEVTTDEDDFVPYKDILKYLKGCKVNQSDNKIGRELTKGGLPGKVKTVLGASIKGRSYLKLLSDSFEE